LGKRVYLEGIVPKPDGPSTYHGANVTISQEAHKRESRDRRTQNRLPESYLYAFVSDFGREGDLLACIPSLEKKRRFALEEKAFTRAWAVKTLPISDTAEVNGFRY